MSDHRKTSRRPHRNVSRQDEKREDVKPKKKPVEKEGEKAARSSRQTRPETNAKTKSCPKNETRNQEKSEGNPEKRNAASSAVRPGSEATAASPTVQDQVIDKLHEKIQNRHTKKRVRQEISNENCMLMVCLQNPGLSPMQMVERVNTYYGTMVRYDDVLEFFRVQKINRPEVRIAIFTQAKQSASLLEQAMKNDLSALNQFEEEMKSRSKEFGIHRQFFSRILLTTFFQNNPAFHKYGDEEDVALMGNTLQFYTLLDLIDSIRQAIENQEEVESAEEKTLKTVPVRELEKASQRIRELESALERTGYLLSDLQDEFDAQLEQNKIREIVKFFSQLNSEKYGFLLDELLALQKGVSRLRKQKYETPPEISGVLILVRKLIQFVQDSHINPMFRLDQVLEITASQAEEMDYEGDPFLDNTMLRKVQVLSPGWIYQDKEIQISRPKVREMK